ncbi:MAG: hypothetical protein GY833_22955 [Aestuariibacter sp.]|nr:hypothetical protein [Aestuariibacter sp.]
MGKLGTNNLPENVLTSVQLPVPHDPNRFITISFERVTPEIAQRWLDCNHDDQRNLDVNLVAQYSRMMKENNWQYDNGESVKFGMSGSFMDGQHRLRSVIASGEAQILMVMRELDDSALLTMDMGKRRTLADLFVINKLEMPQGLTESRLATIAVGLFYLRRYALTKNSNTNSQRIDSFSQSRSIRPTPLELYKFIKANPEIIERLSKLDKYKLATISKAFNISGVILGWFVADLMDENHAHSIMMTFQELMPQTEKGRQCPSYRLVTALQKMRTDNNEPHRFESPWMYVWAVDSMIRDVKKPFFNWSNELMPAQGHERSKEVYEYFAAMRDE